MFERASERERSGEMADAKPRVLILGGLFLISAEFDGRRHSLVREGRVCCCLCTKAVCVCVCVCVCV